MPGLSGLRLTKFMSKKAGVIGPTNLEKLSKITGKPTEFFLDRTGKIGKILAEANYELWVNSDEGLTFNTAKLYKGNKGKKLVILFPSEGAPWPKDHVRPHKDLADQIENTKNWFWSNYNVVSVPDICVCVGLSAGTLSELAYIKWNCQLERGNLKKLFAVRELLREGKLPPEIEQDIKEVLVYVDKVENLQQKLKEIN